MCTFVIFTCTLVTAHLILDFQRLHSVGEPHWHLLPNQGRLHEFGKLRRKLSIFLVKAAFLKLLQYSDNKGFAEDLTEGKFSFPIVHAVRSDTTNRQVLSMYFLHTPCDHRF
jgi:hypothetical protein